MTRKYRGDRAQQVLDKETGTLYESINVCSRAVGISAGLISKRIKAKDPRFKPVKRRKVL